MGTLTINVYRKEGDEYFLERAKVLERDDFDKLTLDDLLHYGNTGLTDEEMKEYLCLSSDGFDLSIHAKASYYKEANLYRRTDVFPSKQLLFDRVIVHWSEALREPHEFIRSSLHSFGIYAERIMDCVAEILQYIREKSRKDKKFLI